MRVESRAERLQKLVTLSEINIYRLDREIKMQERYVLFPDTYRIQGDAENELHVYIRQMTDDLPVIWESKEGLLVGIEKMDDGCIYVTSAQRQSRLVKLLTLLEMVDEVLYDRAIFQKDIMIRHNVDYNAEGSQVEDLIQNDMNPSVYHSYNDEMALLNAIRSGDKDTVHEFLEKGFIQTFPQTSQDPLTHYRNICITSITMASRAAIEGGVPATLAYDFANAMMKQVDRMPSVSQEYAFICSVFNRYTRMVNDAKMADASDSIVEQCRQYVLVHYKEAITVGEIADYVERSPNYVSAIFKKKTGESLSQFINKEKISAAKNILRYSNMDVATVSNFLSFSSQAYFGKVFKEVTGTTPKKYKDEHRVKELSFDNIKK